MKPEESAARPAPDIQMEPSEPFGVMLMTRPAEASIRCSPSPSQCRDSDRNASPAQIDDAVEKKKTGAFGILPRIEGDLPRRVGKCGLYGRRAPGLLRAGREVESMQTLAVISAGVLRHGDDKNCSAGAGFWVDLRESRLRRFRA